MHQNSKIYIAGHKGMVGAAIARVLNQQGYRNLLTRSSSELDLRNQSAVQEFFEKERPEFVFFGSGQSGRYCCEQHLSR